jgi:phosphohistidine phosphatase SixA
MKITKYLAPVLLLVLLSGCTTTYYFVRHAERLDDSADSPLSAAGNIRAQILKDSLLNKGIDSIFATPYLRTQQTAQPLAVALGKPVILYGTGTTVQFVRALKKMRGKDLLIVGHSNTVPEMVRYMSGGTVAIGHDDYDNLFIIKIKRQLGGKKVRLTEATYGPPIL